MEFTLTAPNSTVLAYGDEKYDVTKLPAQTSLIVNDMKQSLLGRLSLVQTFENMTNAVDLFYIVNLAVDGITGLHVNVFKLRQDFIKTLSNSANICAALYQKTNYAPIFFVGGYKAVISGDFDSAKKAFAEVSKIAAEVIEKAKELSNLFDDLANRSQTVCTDIIEARASDYDKNRELQDMIDKLNAKTKGLKEAQNSLDDEIAELQEEYLKLDKRLASAENKAFWMGIASVVASCISSGLSAYASTTVGGAVSSASQAISGKENRSGSKQAEDTPSASGGGAASSAISSTQEHLDATNRKISETQERIRKLDADIADLDDKISKADNDEEKEKLIKEKEKAVKERESEKSALELLKTSSEQDKEIIKGIAASLNNASEGLDKLSSEEKDAVKNLTARIDAISSKKTALAKERRSLLSQIAENTSIIESTVITQNELNLAISALSAGIAAMQYIVNMLNNFVKFWGSVKAFADGLQVTELTALISVYENMPDELLSLDMLTTVIKNTASWVALREVLNEYKNNYDAIFHRLNEQLKTGQEVDRTESWKKAVELSKGINHIFQLQADQV